MVDYAIYIYIYIYMLVDGRRSYHSPLGPPFNGMQASVVCRDGDQRGAGRCTGHGQTDDGRANQGRGGPESSHPDTGIQTSEK